MQRGKRLRLSVAAEARAVAALGSALLLSLLTATCDLGTHEPGSGWCGVDTLYVSGMAVDDTADVHAAFEAYIAFVDTTAAEFPDESDWRYVTSRPFKLWRGRFYWEVDHYAYSSDPDARVLRRSGYIDENGVVVRPLGCM